jgi:hypothetical protein
MAFPSVRSISVGDEANSTAPSYTLPATIVSGDLILVYACTDNTANFTVPTGFTEILNAQTASAFKSQVFVKIADGTEDSTTVDGTLDASESTSYIALAIQDWYGTVAGGISVSTGATNVGTDADPDSVTASWGSDDNLFIAVVGGDYANKTATAYPTSYADNQTTHAHSGGGGGQQAVSLATRELAAASDDPASFTLVDDVSDTWAAHTIVVRPAAAGGAATPKQRAFKGPFKGAF